MGEVFWTTDLLIYVQRTLNGEILILEKKEGKSVRAFWIRQWEIERELRLKVLSFSRRPENYTKEGGRMCEEKIAELCRSKRYKCERYSGSGTPEDPLIFY